MLGIESLGLNNPDQVVIVIINLVFLVISFKGLEGLDYAKMLRKPYHNRALLLHVLLSVALAYLVSNFVLTVMFKG